MRMEFDCGETGGGIVVGDGEGFAAGSGAAVEDFRSAADESGDKLRGFVLNDDLACTECLGFCDVPGLNAAGGFEQGSGDELDSFISELRFGLW